MNYKVQGRHGRKKTLSRAMSMTLSAALLMSGVGMSYGTTVYADTTELGGVFTGSASDETVSPGDAMVTPGEGPTSVENIPENNVDRMTVSPGDASDSVTQEETVSPGDAVAAAFDLLTRGTAGTYQDFTENELVAVYAFDGTDISADTVYSEDTGVGFRDIEYNNAATGWNGSVYYPREVSKNAPGTSYVTTGDGCLAIGSKVWTETEETGYGVYTYENTSAFSLELAPADYQVDVTLVNPTASAYTAYLEAEDITKASDIVVDAGKEVTKSFTAVLVDGILDLKFLVASSATDVDSAAAQTSYVSRVAVTRLATNAQGSKPTIFIASDSTVQTYEKNYYPQTGWGQTLSLFFGEQIEERECDDCGYSQAQTYEAANVIVENRAIGGRSSKSFVEEGKLDDLLEDIKPGDYLFVQWGHNDATASRPNRYVSSSDFEKWIQYYVDGALQRGATPVLVTPVARYSYITKEDGTLDTFVGNFEAYGNVMRTMAEEQNIPLIDLTARSVAVCNNFGIEGAKSLFLHVAAGEYPEGAYAGGATDSTHLQYYGAYKFAQCVAQGIQDSSLLTDLAQLVVISIPENVPGKIANLASGSVGASSVSMSWDADENAELYYIYREALTEGQTASDVDFTNAQKYSVSSINKYTDSGCEAGVTYVYAVRGFNEKGLGEFSDIIEVTTKSAGWKFDINASADGPTEQGWTGVYNEMYKDNKEKGWGWITYPGAGRDRGVQENDAYSLMGRDFSLGEGEFALDIPNGDYEVTVYGGDILPGTSTQKTSYTAEGTSIGTMSARQTVASVTNTIRVVDGQLNIGIVSAGALNYFNGFTVTELLKAPSGFVTSELTIDTATGQASYLIGFNPVDEAVAYRVYAKNSTDKNYSVVKSFTKEQYQQDELSCRAMTGDAGETYSLYITCVTADGTESAPSNTVELKLVQEGAKAAAPKNLKCTSPAEGATKLQKSISLGWDAVDGAFKYIIYRSDRLEDEKGYKGFEKVGESRTTAFTDTNDVATNINYYYKVAAMTVTGLGEFSEICKTPITGVMVAGAREKYTDRALVAINLAGADGGETVVTATDKDGNEYTNGVYLSWRSFEADLDANNNVTTGFDVYRDGTLIADDIKVTNLVDPSGSTSSVYKVVGSNDSAIGVSAKDTTVWANKYLELSLYCPDDETMPDGTTCDYHANDMSVGDLDGDGELELIVKWYPSNAKDNSGYGYTGKTFLDGYDVDFATGATRLLWRIDMGVNIRSGAHYTQFQVWDFDCDGKAEIAVKTADGTTTYKSTDGTAAGLVMTDYVGACSSEDLPTNIVSEQNDYRNTNGFVLDGPEYFSIFNGEDGTKAAPEVAYLPARGSVGAWGDTYGNRVDRFLSATAYLNGETPFAVFARGYYTRTCLTAYYMKDSDGDGVGDAIDVYWEFDTNEAGTQYEAQGNHGIGVNDIDNDGKDEIIYGALVIDHNGTVKYSTGLGHGDAMHISDWVSWNDGLEIMCVHEHDNAAYHVEIHDAETGEILMGYYTGKDTGRGVAADIDPTAEGAEWWSIASPTYEDNEEPEWDSTNGEVYSTWSTLDELVKLAGSTPASNASIFWDGDLLSEIQDHSFDKAAYAPLGVKIYKWDYENEKQIALLDSSEIWSNNGTKGNVGLIADILGDWREEIITRASADKNKVRIYSTTIETDYVVPCLLENLAYREGVAWENVGYNQPANLSYLLSKGLVTAQLSEGEGTTANSTEILFTPANDGDLFGHDITGYKVYRAEGDGEFEEVKEIPKEELKKADASGSGDAEEEKPEEQEPVYLKFDFGGVDGKNASKVGPAMEGYTEITSSSKSYEESTEGYGLTKESLNGITFRYYSGGTTTFSDDYDSSYAALFDDCAMGWNSDVVFKANVPNGTYDVKVLTAHVSGTSGNLIYIQNMEENVARYANKYAVNETKATVNVTDGVLTVKVTLAPKYAGAVLLNGLEIKDVTYDKWLEEQENVSSTEPKLVAYKFDFGGVDGKNASKVGPAMEGYTEITSSSKSYEESAEGYGLTKESLNGITFRYYAGGTTTFSDNYDSSYAALFDDCAMGWNSDVVFKANVPNGTYDVKVLTAHVSGTSGNLIYIQNMEENVARYANKYAVNETKATVDVTDGVLTIKVTLAPKYAGAVLLNGLEIVQTKAAEETPEPGEDDGDDDIDGSVLYTYTDTGLTGNTEYTYKIAAVVDGKASYVSRPVTIKTAIEIASVPEIKLDNIVEGTPLEEGQTVADLLPETIKVVDSTGAEVNCDVTWDVSSVDINKTGEYTVYASIKGQTKTWPATLTVEANQVKGVEKLEAVDVIIGGEAKLPEKVKVEYTNTTSAEVEVVWNTENLDTNTLGEYRLTGTVADFEGVTAEITVNVIANYIAGIADSYLEIDVKTKDVAAKLPKTVKAAWGNGEVTEEAVVWSADSVDTTVVGEVELTGTVEGFQDGAKLHLAVVYPAVYRFDFGINGSPETAGWTTVTVNPKAGGKPISTYGAEYTKEKGYGFLNGDATFDGRSEVFEYAGYLPASVYTDFAIPDGNTFAVDLEKGKYQVDVLSNSSYKSTVKATVEGKALSVSNAAGTYTIGSVEVDVTDGQLTIDFTAGTTSRMGAIIVREISKESQKPTTPDSGNTGDSGNSNNSDNSNGNSDDSNTTDNNTEDSTENGTENNNTSTSTPATESNTSAAGKSNQSTANSTETVVNAKEVVKKFVIDVVENWDEVDAAVEGLIAEAAGANKQAVIEATLGKYHVVEPKVMEAIQGKNIELRMNQDNGIVWEVNGVDIDRVLDNVSLEVVLNGEAISTEEAKALAGDNDYMPLSLSHNGEFGFKATMRVPFETKDNGKYANLFYYNNDKEFEFMSSCEITEEYAEFIFTHASEYLVVISDTAMTAASVGSNEETTTQPEDTQKEQPSAEQSSDEQQTPTEVITESNSSMPVILIVIAVVAIGAVVIGVLVFRKKKDEE